jgi:glycosyltransferase involved in cell wall biosynthesis
MNILISAFACKPGAGSERGQGWNWSLQAARYHQVWVLTNLTQRLSIEGELTRNPNPNLNFIYFDVPKWVYPFSRVGASHKPYYLLWQVLAVWKIWRAHRAHHFDVVHHLSYNAIDAPGFLWLLPIPFVWGPVGGGQLPPVSLRRYFGHRWSFERFRAFKKGSLRVDPVVRAAIQRACHILVANADTERRLRKMGATRLTRCLDAGVSILPEKKRPACDQPGTLTIIWSGLFVHRKAPGLAIDAFELLVRRGTHARLIMIGDGPLRNSCERIVREKQLDGLVELPGRLPFAEMQAAYSRGDVFLFTSLQDTSGNVVLEAMANELPVVALNHHGAAEMVDAESGVLIDIGTERQVVEDIGCALNALARDAPGRRVLGRNARTRVLRLFDWDTKAAVLKSVYSEASASSD